MVINSGFVGTIFPVNPGVDEVIGRKCYVDIESLPKVVDHIVLALGNQHLEAALKSAITHGARAVTIYSSGILAADTNPPLLERLTYLATQAKIAICGCNGMGFYNVQDDLYTGIFAKVLAILHSLALHSQRSVIMVIDLVLIFVFQVAMRSQLQ